MNNSISKISMGTMNLPDATFRLRLFDYAFERGLNHFDTAVNYLEGESELFLGDFIKGKNRDKIILSSKAFFSFDKSFKNGLRKKNIQLSVEKSLSRLKTDYLDVFYCHRYDVNTNVIETLEAINDLIESGKILEWGICAFTPFQVCEMYYTASLLGFRKPTFAQYPYNLFNRTIDMDLKEVLKKLNFHMITYYPLAQGVLSCKYNENNIPPSSRGLNKNFRKSMWDLKIENYEKISRFKNVAEDWGMSPSVLAYSWCLNNNNITSVLTTASNFNQFEEILKSQDVFLDDSKVIVLNKLFDNEPINRFTGVKY